MKDNKRLNLYKRSIADKPFEDEGHNIRENREHYHTGIRFSDLSGWLKFWILMWAITWIAQLIINLSD